jgi:hypothetical protein
LKKARDTATVATNSTIFGTLYGQQQVPTMMGQQLIQPNPQFAGQMMGQQSILPPKNLNPQFGQMGQQQPHLNPQFGQSIQSAFHEQQQNQQPSPQDLYAFFHQQQQQPLPQDLYAFFQQQQQPSPQDLYASFSSSNHNHNHHNHTNHNHHHHCHKISIHFGNFIKI